MSRSRHPKCRNGRDCGTCGDEGEARRAREAQGDDAVPEVLADRNAFDAARWMETVGIAGPLRGTDGDDTIPEELRELLDEIAAQPPAEPDPDWAQRMAESLSRFTD